MSPLFARVAGWPPPTLWQGEALLAYLIRSGAKLSGYQHLGTSETESWVCYSPRQGNYRDKEERREHQQPQRKN